MLWETTFKSLAEVYMNRTHITKAAIIKTQCSPYIHSCGHFITEGKQAGQLWFACVKLCWGLSRILLHLPRNGLPDFPRDWNNIDLPIIPQILLLVLLKTIIYNNVFHMLLHTKGHHTWHNLCKVFSHLSCGHLLDYPSLPKIICRERKGGMRNSHVSLKWNPPSDSWESNPITILSAPTAESQLCSLKPVQV